MDTGHKHYNEIVSNPKFRAIKDKIPRTESLETTMLRVVPFWNSTIVPDIKSGKRVLVVCHGTSLRGIVKHVKRELTACCDVGCRVWTGALRRETVCTAGKVPTFREACCHRQTSRNVGMCNCLASHNTLTSNTVTTRARNNPAQGKNQWRLLPGFLQPSDSFKPRRVHVGYEVCRWNWDRLL